MMNSAEPCQNDTFIFKHNVHRSIQAFTVKATLSYYTLQQPEGLDYGMHACLESGWLSSQD